jgi:hypothetical protein
MFNGYIIIVFKQCCSLSRMFFLWEINGSKPPVYRFTCANDSSYQFISSSSMSIFLKSSSAFALYNPLFFPTINGPVFLLNVSGLPDVEYLAVCVILQLVKIAGVYVSLILSITGFFRYVPA